MSDDAVKDEVLDVLRSMYPNTTIPEPDAFYFPRWKSDPLYRGSYSNWPSSFLKAHHTNLRATVDGRLWFGGEATSLKYFGTFGIVRVTLSGLVRLTESRNASFNMCSSGYLHGAYYEGQKMGEEIAHCVLKNGCAGLTHTEEIPCSHPYIASDFI